jgi:hypothetical protein
MSTKTRCPICDGSKGPLAKVCGGCRVDVYRIQEASREVIEDKLVRAKLRVRQIEAALR